MVATNRIDPPVPSVVEEDVKTENEMTEASWELGDAPSKEVQLSQKVVPILRPPPPFP